MVREFLLTIKHPVHPISRSANVRTYEIWKVIKWYSGTLLIVISKDTWLLEVTDSEVLQYECLSDDYETRSHCLMKKIWNNHWLFLGWRSSPSSSMSSPSPSSSRSSCYDWFDNLWPRVAAPYLISTSDRSKHNGFIKACSLAYSLVL